MNLLVVDDEERIRTIVKEYSKAEGYNVFETDDGYEVFNIIDKNKIDIIILDIMMPKMDGITLYKQIKDRGIPTIILSARSEEYDKLLGFDLGIDDYMTKPFSPRELMARIKAVLKRFSNIDKFNYKTLEIDFRGHVVKIDGKDIKLTPKEYELLTFFINNKNIALSREELLSKIWGYDFFGDDRTIDTHIKMLRNNLGDYRDLIKTVRSVGYKFEIE